ncbi:hypothetical protein LTR28_002123, partial [Elasticomyces elasticus]
SLVAFALLGLVDPVSYSVASLIKRVFVIAFAVVWFGSPMSRVQALGFVLTFLGLYLYDRTSDAARADRRARAVVERRAEPLLPVAGARGAKRSDGPPGFVAGLLGGGGVGAAGDGKGAQSFFGGGTGYANGQAVGSGPGRPRGYSGAAIGGGAGALWLPPGTRQEETWIAVDADRVVSPGTR